MSNLTRAIREKAVDLECLLVGNRLTTLGRASLLLPIPAANYFININNPNDLIRSIGAFAILSPIFFWGGMEYFTWFGKETNKIYKRTKKHIKRYDKIDERFVKAIFKGEECGAKYDDVSKKSPFGYCEWQGVYLAARALGKNKEFNEIKQQYYRKKIPLI